MRLFSILVCLSLAACAHRAPSATPAPTDARAELAAARAVSLQRIHEYMEAGVFPLDDQGRPTSIFRDSSGRLCAMASLIDRSGRRDLVDEVVRTNNHLKLADVHDGPLMDWMLQSGLTQDEIALVQGALDINWNQLERPNEAPVERQVVLARGRAEIKRRLADAEKRLAANTNASLDVAAARRVHVRVVAKAPAHE